MTFLWPTDVVTNGFTLTPIHKVDIHETREMPLVEGIKYRLYMIFLLDFRTIQAVIVYSLAQSFLAKNIESADTTVNLISSFYFAAHYIAKVIIIRTKGFHPRA